MTLAIRRGASGFRRGDFIDGAGRECSIEESAMAGEDRLRLGCTGARMNLSQAMARDLLPLLQTFVETGNLFMPRNPDPQP